MDEKGYIDGKWFVIHDGQKIGEDYNFVEFRRIADVGGKPAFTAQKDGKSFIVYDGKEIGMEYDGVDDPASINGKLAFRAEKDDKQFIIMEK